MGLMSKIILRQQEVKKFNDSKHFKTEKLQLYRNLCKCLCNIDFQIPHALSFPKMLLFANLQKL